MIPSLFVGHGAPTIVLENNEYTDFLKKYAGTIPKPKGIIIFSAHWESTVQLIGNVPQYKMIYDFYGFPNELYTVSYPAAGDPHLAQQIHNALLTNGIASEMDSARGIDHGAWTVLKLLYPDGEIPVVTMSVNPKLKPKEHYKIGQSLRKFKEDGYLILCSGGIVHNLRALKYDSQGIDDWALNFNQWVQDKVEKMDLDAIFDYQQAAPYSGLAVPRNEHFLNLLIALGTANPENTPTLRKNIYQYGNLSLDLWEFA